MDDRAFKYRFARLPLDHEVLRETSCTAATLRHKISQIDLL